MQRMSSPTGSRSAVREVDDGAVVAAFQPIIDLRDGCVVGYEALARPRDGSSPEQLFARARAEGRLSEVDRECRAAALRDAAAAGLGAPFALFLNADAGALELDLPDLPHGSATLIMALGASALTERPESVLRTLTRLRLRGPGHARARIVAGRCRRRLALVGDDAAALSRRDHARAAAAGLPQT